MKFILLSDIHLSWDNPIARIDDVREVQLRKLRWILEYAGSKDAIILQAGDFFDRPRNWYLLPEVINIFKKYFIIFVGIFGQHDTYMYSEGTRSNTNLGILNQTGLIKIAGPERNDWLETEDSVIIGCSFGQVLDKEDLKSFHKDKNKILIIHAPIGNSPLFPGHQFTLARKFLMDNSEFDLILCADIHRYFLEEYKNRIIFNSGPMVRRTAEEYNFTHKPCFGLYDTNKRKIEVIEIPHAKAESVLTRDHIDRKKEAENKLNDFISMIKDDELDSVSFEENLNMFIQKNKINKSVAQIISEVMGERR